MNGINPVTVTFDRNVYEGIINPGKNGLLPEQSDHAALIAELIRVGRIAPFLCESSLTLETLSKKGNNRRDVLSRNRIELSDVGETSIRVGGVKDLYPGTSFIDRSYITGAIQIGFRILPIFRLGRLVNPDIQAEWRYYKEYEEYMGLAERWGEAVRYIEELGAGFASVKSLLKIPEDRMHPWTFYAKLYSGSEKKFNKAVAEWSDGDSIASHIANGIQCFCTYDQAKGAGSSSVFSQEIKDKLKLRFDLKVVSPEELIAICR